jgi:hypothetical protein
MPSIPSTVSSSCRAGSKQEEHLAPVVVRQAHYGVVCVAANDYLGVSANGCLYGNQIMRTKPHTRITFLSSCKRSVCMQSNELHNMAQNVFSVGHAHRVLGTARAKKMQANQTLSAAHHQLIPASPCWQGGSYTPICGWCPSLSSLIHGSEYRISYECVRVCELTFRLSWQRTLHCGGKRCLCLRWNHENLKACGKGHCITIELWFYDCADSGAAQTQKHVAATPLPSMHVSSLRYKNPFI